MIPPHRAISLPGLHAYTDRLSVSAGENIGIHVSSSEPYTVSLRKLGQEMGASGSDEILASMVVETAKVQPIHPGSYVHIKEGLPPGPVHAMTVECWLRPWHPERWQTVISQMDINQGKDTLGFGLFIDPAGHLVAAWGRSPMCIEQGSPDLLRSGQPLTTARWVHVVATFEHGRSRLWLDGRSAAEGAADPDLRLNVCPLRIGACGVGGIADHFLDADIVMPSLHGIALDVAGIHARMLAQGRELAAGPNVLACWPLDERTGDAVRDAASGIHCGRLINHGTWMINGPGFSPDRVPRYRGSDDQHTDPSLLEDRNGLRLASDDLVDCRWSSTHAFLIPHEARSGLHVCRFSFSLNGEHMNYDVTFNVRRPEARPPAPLLVLCSTNTWLAYAASPFAENHAGPVVWPRRCAGLPNSHPLAPSHCTYTFHRAGQPCYYVGLRMPRPHTSPSAFYAPEDSGFAQWTRLELNLHHWLDQHGYDYDVATDLDLHRSPAMLNDYRAVVINGHSEYWSQPAYDGLERYLNQGGCVAVLSGNSMYWRVSFNDDCSVMEQRKTHTPHDPEAGAVSDVLAPAGEHGEQYHSQDGRRGGLWRFADRSCARVIGLETAGWGFAHAKDFGVYRVRQAGHRLFNTPFSTGLVTGDSFGHGPNGALPRAVGHEWDLTTNTLLRMTRHWPADAPVPERQDGIEVIAEGIREVPGELDAYLDYFEAPVASIDGLSCEMIYWRRPQGGQVFNAGAVGASWVLGVDEHMGRLLANVLAAFDLAYPETGPYRRATADVEACPAASDQHSAQ